MRRRVITIDVDGGLVQDVFGVPAGYVVKVRDFDLDGAGPADHPSIKPVYRRGLGRVLAFVSWWSR